ncbi:helix-turn-helix transcriptional regulator [Persicobacter diffluens]|uniref:HTH cro/C1-type domain-containing protein n=1 Tax=Persicobacter diffluens TaxID=981 RepID=A0AAN4W1A0_9BACT|nr:hypothetical protein PEDI_40400 [Persicobacter diffluens]
MHISEEGIKIILGLKVKELRTHHGLSLTELAKKTGLSVSYLNEIEKGKKYPKTKKLMDLAEGLEVSYDDLVGLKLSKKMEPIGTLLNSNILENLPLEMLGLELNKLVEIIASAPTKINAFISTLIKISRRYNMSEEDFNLAALRSYLEMHENYFEYLEEEAEKFMKKHSMNVNDKVNFEQLAKILYESYNIKIEEDSLSKFSELQHIRSVMVEGEQPTLYIKGELNESQKTFVIGRELGYRFLNIKEREYTYSSVEIDSFEQVLNNHKVTYFSGAIIMNRTRLLQDLDQFAKNTEWDSEAFRTMMYRYTSSSETFMHRLTTLIPTYWEINNLFYLRFHHGPVHHQYTVTKELHFARHHTAHAIENGEHYCRRWSSIRIFDEYQELKAKDQAPDAHFMVQRSQYQDSGEEYFVISLVRPSLTGDSDQVSVSIGFTFNDVFKERFHFWDDPNIPILNVNETCERCSIRSCKERASAPLVLEKAAQRNKIMNQLHELNQLT